MDKTDKKFIGQLGEDLAVRFFEKQGFSILDRNYWKKWGEIDVVAKRRGAIHFVEVKTVSRATMPMSDGNDYEPEDNIHPWKRQRLARVIETYLLDKKIGEDVDWQVDALAVYVDLDGNLLKYDWLEDICL